MRSVRILAPLFAVFFLLLNALPAPVNACDPLGCLVIGKDQDVLALVTIQRVEPGQAYARIDYTHSQKGLRDKRHVTVRVEQGTSWGLSSPRVGEHYFISLACTDNSCVTKWGAWQVDSSDHASAKLLRIRNGDDAAIQWLMNGNGSEFYGEGDKMFARTAQGSMEIYPNDPTSIVPSKSQFLWLSKLLPGISVASIIIFLLIRQNLFPSNKI